MRRRERKARPTQLMVDRLQGTIDQLKATVESRNTQINQLGEQLNQAREGQQTEEKIRVTTEDLLRDAQQVAARLEHKLQTNPKQYRRVRRTYIIEGDPVWVAETLKRSLANGAHIIGTGDVKRVIVARTETDDTIDVIAQRRGE